MSMRPVRNLLRRMLPIVLFGTLFFALLSPVLAAGVDTKQASALSAFKDYLTYIFERFLEIQKQVVRIIEETKEKEEGKAVFTTDLARGSEGNEVKELQQLLKGYGDIYPEGLVTGIYGPLTEAAVKRLQKENGISETGTVDAATRQVLNALAKEKDPQQGEDAEKPSDAEKPENNASKTPTSTPSNETPEKEKGYAIGPERSYDIALLTQLIHDRVNAEREKNGLSSLLWSSEAAAVAVEHSTHQAADNILLTDPTRRCHYPVIRHEGFVFGFSVSERVTNRKITYRSVGENIALVPVVHNLVYQYPATMPPKECPTVASFPSGHWEDKEAAKAAYDAILTDSREAVQSIGPVTWVNKEWRTPEEVADEIVQGWMNSPGHRENILRERFVRAGMGVAKVNDYVIATQVFLAP